MPLRVFENAKCGRRIPKRQRHKPVFHKRFAKRRIQTHGALERLLRFLVTLKFGETHTQTELSPRIRRITVQDAFPERDGLRMVPEFLFLCREFAYSPQVVCSLRSELFPAYRRIPLRLFARPALVQTPVVVNGYPGLQEGDAGALKRRFDYFVDGLFKEHVAHEGGGPCRRTHPAPAIVAPSFAPSARPLHGHGCGS
jgi:hypothetical protein